MDALKIISEGSIKAEKPQFNGFASTNSDTEREKNGVSATSTRTRL